MSSSSFKTPIMISSRTLLKRLDEEVSLCRTDERNVTTEMKHLMLAETKKKLWNVTTMANALLRFLKDKYDTKNWVVGIVVWNSTNKDEIKFPLGNRSFHTANSINNGSILFAAAISVGRKGSAEFDKWVSTRLNASVSSTFPLNPTNPAEDSSDKREVHDYLNKSWERLNEMNKQGVETLTIVEYVPSSNEVVGTSNNIWSLFKKEIGSNNQTQVLVLAVNKTNSYNSATESTNFKNLLPHDKKLSMKHKIENRMREILDDKTSGHKDRVGVADALLHFLEDEHNNTRKWIVIVISDGGTNTVDHIQSGGFYTASAGGLFAAAVSVKRSDEDPQVWEMFKDRLKSFEFPIETIVDNKTHNQNEEAFSLKRKDGAYVIYQMLNNYLFPPLSTCANVAVESIVITTPCTARIFEYTTIVATSDLKWIPMTEQDECAEMLIISLPIRTGLVMPLNGPQYYRNHFSSNVSERIGLLRNEYGQVYLSVEENPNKDNKRITVDVEWKDLKHQRWQFVNNTLKNDHGKCLVAKNKTSHQALYQQTCLADSYPGQTWNRKGLQIVNGFNLCLALIRNKEKGVMGSNYVVVQDLCDTTSPFLWYNWDVDLDDVVIVHPTGNGSRALRNDFSRRYLSVSLEGKVKHEQWSNQPGQNWQVVNKQLRNGQGIINCLTNSSTFLIREKKCAGGEQKAKIWTMSDKRQIVCAHNKCLSVGDRNGYITCVSCNDTPKQHWRFK